jgi:hypothetical protein
MKPGKDTISFVESYQEKIDRLLKQATAEIVITSSYHGFDAGHIEESYVDFDLAVYDPSQALTIAELYVQFIHKLQGEQAFDGLAFIKKNDEESSNTIGALQLATQISTHPLVWLPYIVVRLDKDIPFERIKFQHGSKSQHDSLYHTATIKRSQLLSNMNYLLITDHISGGSEIVEAIQVLESFGAKVSHVITFTIRTDLFNSDERTKAFLKDHNVQLIGLRPVSPDEKGKLKPQPDVFRFGTSGPGIVPVRGLEYSSK